MFILREKNRFGLVYFSSEYLYLPTFFRHSPNSLIVMFEQLKNKGVITRPADSGGNGVINIIG
ncbi:MAG: hypothetical protein ACK55I_33780, partial [bacterium]